VKLFLNSQEIILHNFYVPAGGDIASIDLNEKFAHKIDFLNKMEQFFKENSYKNQIALGDFNIAIEPNDVWSHRQLLQVVSHTPIEVEKLGKIKLVGNFHDSHRHFVDGSQKLYSWWSYRAKQPLISNRGRRLDYIWCSANLLQYLQNYQFFINYRTALSPSDHIPILTEFAVD